MQRFAPLERALSTEADRVAEAHKIGGAVGEKGLLGNADMSRSEQEAMRQDNVIAAFGRSDAAHVNVRDGRESWKKLIPNHVELDAGCSKSSGRKDMNPRPYRMEHAESLGGD